MQTHKARRREVSSNLGNFEISSKFLQVSLLGTKFGTLDLFSVSEFS